MTDRPDDVYPKNSKLHLAVYTKFCEIVFNEMLHKFRDGTEADFKAYVENQIAEQLAFLLWVKSLDEATVKSMTANFDKQMTDEKMEAMLKKMKLN